MQKQIDFKRVKLNNIKFMLAYYNTGAIADYLFISDSALFIKAPSVNWTLYIDNNISRIIIIRSHSLSGRLALDSQLKVLYKSIICRQ